MWKVFLISMSNTDRNDNPQMVRKQLNAENEAKIKEPGAAKGRKASQHAAKEGQPKVGPEAGRGGSLRRAKGTTSIEPTRTTSQSQINSQMVAVSLKKRSMAPSKKGSLSRAAKAYEDPTAGTDSAAAPGSSQKAKNEE